MSTNTSKKQAIALIRDLVASGFSREVHVYLSDYERKYKHGVPSAVTVELRKQFVKGLLFDTASTFVSFRRGFKRSSVSVMSFVSYDRKPRMGLAAARYGADFLARTEAACNRPPL